MVITTKSYVKSSPGPPGPPAKTFFCVFCRDIVSLAVGDLELFKTHMEDVHQVFYEFDILLALNFIDRREKEKIIDTVKNKVNGKSELLKQEAVVDTTEEENLLRDETDWGNLDNVQVVILDENTSINDAIKNIAPPKDKESKVMKKPSSPSLSQFKHEIKQEPEVVSRLMKKTYKCGKCDKIFENQYKLKTHMKKKLSCVKPVLTCEKCSKRFKDTQSFKIHMFRRNSCVKPKCENCSKVFKGPKAYKVHMSRRNSCVKPKCEKCSKVFKGLTAFKDHMSRKKSCVKPEISCEKCNKIFDKSSSYQVHMAKKKSCVKPSLKCEDCLKVFSNTSSLKNHKSKETLCKKRVSCEKCGKLVRESKYKLHLNKKRGCVKISLKCDDCLKIFSSRGAARMHQLKKEIVCKRRIECEKCGERFREKLYQKHILRSCVKVECQKCGEKFTEGKLKLHLQRKRSCVVEEVEEPKCDDCGKIFSAVATAKKHMAERKGMCNMKFGCENCGNSFSGIHSLKMHQKTSKHCLQLQTISDVE